MAGFQKRISKLISPLKLQKGGSKGAAVRTLTVVCTNNQTTEDVLAQLQDVSQNKHVTCVVLREMIQRPDNVQLFSRIHDLLGESKYFSNVKSIHLVEPRVHCDQYRRWCFKKTNFLHRIRKEAKERDIEVTINGTLILDSNTGAESNDNNPDTPDALSQNVSNWLTLFQQLPNDPDITSLWIYLKDEAVVNTGGGRRPSQLDLLQSPVRKVFQALVELFNADTRQWQFINCHVLYHPSTSAKDKGNDESIHEERTQSLLDVAELYHIPLQVQWQPASAPNGTATVAPTQARCTSAALQKFRGSTTSNKGDKAEGHDDTSTTFEGSSGAFTAGALQGL